MKKITALLLLMIMAVSAIRPAIAMHYCMGELQSFDLYPKHEMVLAAASCCPSSGPGSAAPLAGQRVAAPGAGCCDDALLELSTDDFQTSPGVSISRVIPAPVVDGLILFTSLSRLPAPEGVASSPGGNFPPEGLFLKDIDILTYICIYRI